MAIFRQLAPYERVCEIVRSERFASIARPPSDYGSVQ